MDDVASTPVNFAASAHNKETEIFSMSVFGAYSRYYNLFYKDKDYAGEAGYVHDLIEKHRPGTSSILDLGCGTGTHALLLAEMGLKVMGVDRSAEMLAVAKRQVKTNVELKGKLQSQAHPSFHLGDIRSIRLDCSFDAVISLFHVMSYQTTNADLQGAFATVKTHLRPGGLFIFDCWYGPAVLTDRPVVRVKRVEDEEIAVTRIVEPDMFANDNLVETNYQVMVRDKVTGEVEELYETHRMRYLFRPEITLLLQEAGMTLVTAEEWMTGREPGYDTWGVCFVAKREEGED
jgi:SAM-dependent methyltransferase